MKKLFLCAAVVAMGSTAFAQTTVDFGVIGRLDANPYFYFNGDKPQYTSGNSVLYTDLECTFGENVAFTWIGHWLTTNAEKIPFKDTPSLYQNTWTSVNNWTDFCYFDFYAGNWTFRLGKDCMAIGGFEYDPYDWEYSFDMTSLLWQNLNSYQWGASVNYMTPSEKSNFMFQALSATCVNKWDEEGNLEIWRPWHNGFGFYSLKYTGEYGPIETNNAYGWMQTTGGKGVAVSGIEFLTLSARASLGEQVKLGVEWQNRRNTAVKLSGIKDFFDQSHRTIITLSYAPIDNIELSLIGGYEQVGIDTESINWIGDEESAKKEYGFGGIQCSYFPLKDNKDLRIHANICANSFLEKGMSATVGILYNHTFHIVK